MCPPVNKKMVTQSGKSLIASYRGFHWRCLSLFAPALENPQMSAQERGAEGREGRGRGRRRRRNIWKGAKGNVWPWRGKGREEGVGKEGEGGEEGEGTYERVGRRQGRRQKGRGRRGKRRRKGRSFCVCTMDNINMTGYPCTQANIYICKVSDS